MRFRGTIALLLLCAAAAGYVYFYEIKGGEKREKAKQEENRLWKVDSGSIQQINLITPDQQVTAVRSGEKEWKLTAPRALDADSDELNRIASSAAEINRESVVESNVSDLARFGLNPAQVSLQFKTKDGKEYKIRFGNNNPTNSSTYGVLEGKNEVFMVGSYVAGTFRKKLEELRNHSVLGFEQNDTQTLDLKSEKGDVDLVKEGDRWWIQGKERWAADSSSVSGILSALSSGRVKEFFDESPEDYATLGFEKPAADVKVTIGKNKAIKHLTVGLEKSKLQKKGEKKAKAEAAKKDEKKDAASPATPELYIARDESRPELFFVEKDLVDKLLKTPKDLRDKALAAFQRWDIDSIVLTNASGTLNFSKAEGGGDWVLGDAKKKCKWDGVNGILDALEKPVKDFLDNPAALSSYGLDKPSIRVVLKQGATVKLECALGKTGKDGVYAQMRGEPFVKVVDSEILAKLGRKESDFLEPPAPAAPAPNPPKK
jgi:hypothetical protein